MEKSYWLLVLKDAVNKFTGGIGNWGRRMIAFMAESAFLFIILYFMPVLGDIQGEERLWLASASAICLSGFLVFVWDFVTAPKRLHRRLNLELQTNRNIIREIYNTEAGLSLLADYYAEGKAIYYDIRSEHEYIARIVEWESKVGMDLRNKYSISDYFSFMTRNDESWLSVKEILLEEWDENTHEKRVSMTSKLHVLEEIISEGGLSYLGLRQKIESALK